MAQGYKLVLRPSERERKILRSCIMRYRKVPGLQISDVCAS